MSLEKIHLYKLLHLFYAPDNKRISALRDDIRRGIRKELGVKGGGGNFYSPFWTDAKMHAAGKGHLPALTKQRIKANESRARLYPKLESGFLKWWTEKRRWKNEPIELVEGVHTQFAVKDLGGVVKIEDPLALHVGDDFQKVIYPYFHEISALPDEGARIALWLLDEALKKYQLSDIRILDIMRSASFAEADHRLKGNERDLFLKKYDLILKEWKKLKKEY